MAITYCIFCNISGERYYGSSTQNLARRMASHKCNLNCSSKQIILRGDYDAYVVGHYDTIEEAREKEDWHIRNKPCINKSCVSSTKEEREKKAIEVKAFYSKKKNLTQKEKRKLYDIDYREKNYEKKQHNHNKKVQCEFCNEYSSNSHLARHQRSIKCKKFQ